MTVRARMLLDLAHELPCQFDFPHNCGTLRGEKRVPCHGNKLVLGRGFSFKVDDPFFAAGCNEAHDFIDGRRPGLDPDTRWWEWLRAHVKTMRSIWDLGWLKVSR